MFTLMKKKKRTTMKIMISIMMRNKRNFIEMRNFLRKRLKILIFRNKKILTLR